MLRTINSLFACSTQSTFHRLQRVQALLLGCSVRTQAPSFLMQLHWLPVSSRIQFKLCTLMYDTCHGLRPQCQCRISDSFCDDDSVIEVVFFSL